MSTDNFIDTYLDALSGATRTAYDDLLPKLQGGRTPPRTVGTPEAEQLATYILLAQDPATLPPADRQRWMQAREATIAGRPRDELAEVVVAMERLRTEVTGRVEVD